MNPPKLPSWLFSRLFPDGGSYSTLGDLEEVYKQVASEEGIFRAGAWYWLQLLKSIPQLLASRLYWGAVMLHNYFKVAFRTAYRHKVYSLINITGLAFGIICVLFIFLWIQDECSYDRYHVRAPHIYRVGDKYESEGVLNRNVYTAAPLGPALVQEFPEIEDYVRIGRNSFWVEHDNKRILEDIFFADPQVFAIFTFPLVAGDSSKVLAEPYSMVISEDASRKYFGDENPVGKVIRLSEWRDFQITGIFKNIPQQSHFRFDFLGSFRDYAGRHFGSWGIQNYRTYLLTSSSFDLDTFLSKTPEFIEKYMGEEARYQYKTTLFLQPLTEIHLHSHLNGELETNGEITHIYLFSAIGLFVLLIACFNYVNLATVLYTRRNREVGIRKVVGASCRHIRRQFLGEALYLSLTALLVALALVVVLLPSINSLVGKHLHVKGNSCYLLCAFTVMLVVGIGAGSYPALSLSAYAPSRVIGGDNTGSIKNTTLRKVLIVAQFTISTVFIISTFVIYSQLHYIQTKKLGFDKEHLLIIPMDSEEVVKRKGLLKSEFLKDTDVRGVSAFGRFMGERGWRQNYWYEGAAEDFDGWSQIRWIPVDCDFLNTYKIDLFAGRDFSPEFSADLNGAYILNESAVRGIGWDSPLGKLFKIIEQGPVVGVVKDFHITSFHREIEPVALYLYPELCNALAVRISPVNTASTLAFLQRTWSEIVPGQLFTFSFADEDFYDLYAAERRVGKIAGYVTFFVVAIACLGLFCLVALTTEMRTKEIGIRKVLGAGLTDIIVLLSREFVVLIVFAISTAMPVSWYAMHKWLQHFAYHAPLSLWIFILSGLFTVGIGLLAVFSRSLIAGSANPVDSLTYE